MTQLTLLLILLSQIQYQSSDPITPDGGLGAGWALVVSFAIIGVLLLSIFGYMIQTFKDEIKAIHNRINTREEEHDELRDQHGELRTRVLLVETTQKLHADNHAEHTAELILNKLRILDSNGNLEKHLKGHLFNKP